MPSREDQQRRFTRMALERRIEELSRQRMRALRVVGGAAGDSSTTERKTSPTVLRIRHLRFGSELL